MPGRPLSLPLVGVGCRPGWGSSEQDLCSQECPTFWVITLLLAVVGQTVSGAASVARWLGTASCFADLSCVLVWESTPRPHWWSQLGAGGRPSSAGLCQCLLSRLSSRLSQAPPPWPTTHRRQVTSIHVSSLSTPHSSGRRDLFHPVVNGEYLLHDCLWGAEPGCALNAVSPCPRQSWHTVGVREILLH